VGQTAPDDARLAFADALDAGHALTLARADGPLVDTTVIAITGVDLDLRCEPGALPSGSLATARLHDGASAWFATLMVISSDATIVRARIGDAVPVTSERWAERVDLVGPAVLRPEAGAAAIVRAESLNVSLTGIALHVRDEAPLAGTNVGVVLAGDGDGSIACRARVQRRTGSPADAILALEIIGISREDHRRLAQAIDRRS
jgi:hypothetical protein